MLSAVFRFKLPELSEHHALCDLLLSFAVERSRVPLVPPSWDLDIVLKHLTPKRRAKGKFHYPTAGLFSSSLKMKIKIFFF